MTPTITPAPIRKSVHVKAAPARAFEIFTAGASRWWLKNFSISLTKSPIKDIVMEPRAGGRWFERGEDGSENSWGKVLAWEPPGNNGGGRLLLAWQINHEFKYDPALLTEVEIRFTPDNGGTLVELEHRHLERMGAGGMALAERFTQGWGALIGSFAQHNMRHEGGTSWLSCRSSADRKAISSGRRVSFVPRRACPISM